MMKMVKPGAIKLLFLLSMLFVVFSCRKPNAVVAGCPSQVCTDLYIIIPMDFFDNNGNSIEVSGLKSVDLRNGTALTTGITPGTSCCVIYGIAADKDKSVLSTDADNVLVTATNPSTGQTKSATLKISGGCNCHVAKLSGPDSLKFD